MWQTFKDNTVATLKWIYNWITVLAVALMGVVTTAADWIDNFTGIDFKAFITEQRAIQIVTGIAVVKAISASIRAATKKA